MKKIYSRETRRGRNHEGSKVAEIGDIIKLDKFDEEDIVERKLTILNRFFEFLSKEKLL